MSTGHCVDIYIYVSVLSVFCLSHLRCFCYAYNGSVSLSLFLSLSLFFFFPLAVVHHFRALTRSWSGMLYTLRENVV